MGCLQLHALRFQTQKHLPARGAGRRCCLLPVLPRLLIFPLVLCPGSCCCGGGGGLPAAQALLGCLKQGEATPALLLPRPGRAVACLCREACLGACGRQLSAAAQQLALVRLQLGKGLQGVSMRGRRSDSSEQVRCRASVMQSHCLQQLAC